MTKKPIKLIPLLDARDFPSDVDDELVWDVNYLNWDNDDYYSTTKKWLEKSFGEEIKQYNDFAINRTKRKLI